MPFSTRFFPIQDAIRNEHGRDFMGAHIVVEWSRGGRGEGSHVRVCVCVYTTVHSALVFIVLLYYESKSVLWNRYKYSSFVHSFFNNWTLTKLYSLVKNFITLSSLSTACVYDYLQTSKTLGGCVCVCLYPV